MKTFQHFSPYNSQIVRLKDLSFKLFYQANQPR